MSLQNNMPPMSSPFNQHPPPRQQQGMLQDIETVRRNYHTALSELTFNSKPIITSLTITAQENQHAANVIVREIEQQIRHNAPGQKLPVLYLIDSICKNVGGVYIDHFARNIGSTFMDAYTLTDPQTRRSFERLLQTWKNGMPNGHPVFSRHVIEPIERALNFMRERQQQHQHQPSHPPPQPQQQQQQQHLPPQHLSQSTPHPSSRYASSPSQPVSRNQQIHVNPNFVPRGTGTGTGAGAGPNGSGSRDPRNRLEYASPPVQDRGLHHHHHQQQQQQQQQQRPKQQSSSQVKKQKKRRRMAPRIEQRPDAQMPPTGEPVRKEGAEQLSQLFSQIQAILPGLPPNQAATVQQQIDQIMHPAPAPAPPTATAVPTPPLAGNPVRLAYAPPASMPPQLPMSTVAAIATPISQPAIATSPPAAAAPAMSALQLVQSLASLGYINSGSPTPPPPATATIAAVPATPPVNTTAITGGKEGLNSPAVGGTMIRLDSKDLQIARPGAVEVLYSGLPLQCKQCGFRYPKTPEGQSKMDAHLDSHFRQNRRMKERVKRGLSRSWFVTEDEWVSGAGGELTSHQAPAFLTDSTHGHFGHGAGSPMATGAADTVSPESHLVVMPDENNRKPCPVCGERFVDFWNDDEEEWMYRNAVSVNNTIYHATCHADALKSGTLVSNNDVDMADEISQTLEAAGMKRKAEELDQSIMNELKMARTDSTDDQK